MCKLDKKRLKIVIYILHSVKKNTFQSRKVIYWSKRMIRNFYCSEKFSSHGYFTLSLLGQNVWTNSTSCKKCYENQYSSSSRKNQEHRKIASLSLQLRSYNKSLPTTRNKIVRIFYKFSARAPKKGHAGIVTVDRSLPPLKKPAFLLLFACTGLPVATNGCYQELKITCIEIFETSGVFYAEWKT